MYMYYYLSLFSLLLMKVQHWFMLSRILFICVAKTVKIIKGLFFHILSDLFKFYVISERRHLLCWEPSSLRMYENNALLLKTYCCLFTLSIQSHLYILVPGCIFHQRRNSAMTYDYDLCTMTYAL